LAGAGISENENPARWMSGLGAPRRTPSCRNPLRGIVQIENAISRFEENAFADQMAQQAMKRILVGASRLSKRRDFLTAGFDVIGNP
jgi:hypothetical protein